MDLPSILFHQLHDVDVRTTPLSPGSMKKHSVQCGTCEAIVEFQLDAVRPYNIMWLQEGYVVVCSVCKCLIQCESTLTNKEKAALQHKYQRYINNTAAHAAVVKKSYNTTIASLPDTGNNNNSLRSSKGDVWHGSPIKELSAQGTEMDCSSFTQTKPQTTSPTDSRGSYGTMFSPVSPSYNHGHSMWFVVVVIAEITLYFLLSYFVIYKLLWHILDLKVRMSSLNASVRLLDTCDQTYCEAVYVIHRYPSSCMHCKLNFGDEAIFALGAPYHCLLHERCAPYFDYNNRTWPHTKPLCSYKNR